MTERDIFIKALEIGDPSRRSEWIHAICGRDQVLCQGVEKLLRAHARAGNFLEKPASDSSQADQESRAPEDVGAVIGDYRLVEQIGVGGCGIVFMAEQQQPVRRKVALKILKAGMDSSQVVARFEAERQALALMDHPNIARIFDGGETAAGRPFVVMEYVKGVPITEYCDEARLPLEQRLSLFVQVCHAVQHAHQKGVIHRDLKPSNILVCAYDGTPVPKVIDFGLAKALHQPLTDYTLHTAHGLMLGTPLYMSPEQAELNNLDIDTRTDIYSLGVILYELLTGSTPLEKQQVKNAAWQEIQRLIKEEEPTMPSTKLSGSGSSPAVAAQRGLDSLQLSRAVRGDLDWIVMKALEKERRRRYETASGLAADVDRFLDDEPVEASPPSRSYRFRKFARRNRGLLTTSVLVSAALVVGSIVSTWQAVRATQAEQRLKASRDNEADQRRIAIEERNLANAARAAEVRQRELAEAAQAQAEIERAAAEANFQKARQAVDEYFTLVSESTLLDVPGLQPLRKDLLHAALRFYQDFAVDRANDPAVLADLAVTFLRVAVINHTVDRNEDALRAIDQALDVIDRLRRNHPEARQQRRQLAGFWKGFRPTSATTTLPRDQRAALRTLNRLAETWSALAAEDPQELAFLSDLAALLHNTGDLLFTAGERTAAIPYFERAAEICEKLVRDRPRVREHRADLARANQFLAELLPPERREEADAACRHALELREALVAEHSGMPQYQLDLSVSLIQFGRRTARQDAITAEASLRRAAELTRSLMLASPTMPLYRLHWYAGSLHLAKVVMQAGRLGESEAILRPLTEFGALHVNGEPPASGWRVRVADTWLNLAQVLAATERPDEAEEALQKCVEYLGNHARSFRNLAWDWVAYTDRRFASDRFASELARRAVELEPNNGVYLNTLGIAHYRAGRYAEAAEVLDRSSQLNSKGSEGALPCDVAFLAMARYRLGREDEARTSFQELQKLLASDKWKADDEAQAYLREALALMPLPATEAVTAQQNVLP